MIIFRSLLKGFAHFLFVFCLTLLINGCGKEEVKALKLGEKAPEFTGTDMTGKTHSLSDYSGQIVILRFFTSNCKYCMADSYIFADYYSEYKGKKLQVLYVNVDENPFGLEKFKKRAGINFPVILDRDKQISDLYYIDKVPLTFVLSPDHAILGMILGGVGEEVLSELLAGYLPE